MAINNGNPDPAELEQLYLSSPDERGELDDAIASVEADIYSNAETIRSEIIEPVKRAIKAEDVFTAIGRRLVRRGGLLRRHPLPNVSFGYGHDNLVLDTQVPMAEPNDSAEEPDPDQKGLATGWVFRLTTPNPEWIDDGGRNLVPHAYVNWNNSPLEVLSAVTYLPTGEIVHKQPVFKIVPGESIKGPVDDQIDEAAFWGSIELNPPDDQGISTVVLGTGFHDEITTESFGEDFLSLDGVTEHAEDVFRGMRALKSSEDTLMRSYRQQFQPQILESYQGLLGVLQRASTELS